MAARKRRIVSDSEKTDGTCGTDGTVSNDAASSGTTENFAGGTRGTGETIDGLVNDAIDPLNDPTGAENSGAFPDENSRPCYRVYEDWCGPDGKQRAGVYWHGMSKGGKNEPPARIDQWLCDPLHVDAITRDGHGNNHGFMLKFRNKEGVWKLWNMPARLLDGGEEMRKELLDQGLVLDIRNKMGVPAYVNAQRPKRRMRAALQVGWYDGAFVLPTQVIGDNTDVFFQSEKTGQTEYSARGSLDNWKSHVAALCVGNPLLMFNVSASFAGPLLKLCNLDGAGFHVFGNSSSGKTTGFKMAASSWGEWKEYMRSWKATANGLEGAACLFNDGLLVLDEIGDGDGREIEKAVYALGNGKGKQRANVTGSAKAVRQWRILTLSNGEKTLEAHLTAHGVTAKAGQLMRLLQIPVFGKYGAFDELHGYPDGKAFSDAAVSLASKYYGTAGIAYLEQLTAAVRSGDDIGKDVKGIAKLIRDGELSSQEGRAAAAFALVATAGELATAYGVTGWAEGAAVEAARLCFAHWRDHRGAGDAEKSQILRMVSDFVSQWGDARFSSVNDDRELHGPRAGYWRDREEGREWLFSSAGLREAVKGFDMRRITETLLAADWLYPAKDGRKVSQLKVKGDKVNVYIVRIPEGGEHGA